MTRRNPDQMVRFAARAAMEEMGVKPRTGTSYDKPADWGAVGAWLDQDGTVFPLEEDHINVLYATANRLHHRLPDGIAESEAVADRSFHAFTRRTGMLRVRIHDDVVYVDTGPDMTPEQAAAIRSWVRRGPHGVRRLITHGSEWQRHKLKQLLGGTAATMVENPTLHLPALAVGALVAWGLWEHRQ